MSLSESDKKRKIKLIVSCLESGLFSDEEFSYLVDIGNLVAPDPKWFDYVWFDNKYKLTVDEAIEKAFAYKPIILGPPE